MPIDDVERRLTLLRREIDELKIALHTTGDEQQRQLIFARISDCFKESIGLVEQRIYHTAAFISSQQRPTAASPAAERHVGQPMTPRR